MIKLGILFSGGGTTADAICQSALTKGQPLYNIVQPVAAISSCADAGGIAKMERHNIPVLVIPRHQHGKDFGVRIISFFNFHNVTHVGQYGWIPMTPPFVITTFSGAIVNQHPAPQEFGGKGMHGKAPHRAVLEFMSRVPAARRWTEAICQRVDPDCYDAGAVLYRMRVPILPDDTTDSLQARVLPVEHLVQITALKLLAEGRLVELPPDPLVLPGEEGLLEDCKRIAREHYPKG